MITWAREVGKLQGFVIVIKKSDINRHGRSGNEKVLLSYDREETYRNRNAKTENKRGHGVQEVRNVVVHSY